jgi:hypothetical protein
VSATVIQLPVIARTTASGAEEVALQVRLPRRVYGRLLKIAELWNVDPSAAAEMLLVEAVNSAAGVKRR